MPHASIQSTSVLVAAQHNSVCYSRDNLQSGLTQYEHRGSKVCLFRGKLHLDGWIQAHFLARQLFNDRYCR